MPLRAVRRVLLGCLLLSLLASAANVPTPSQFLGFDVGADKQLADYRQIVSYFKALAAASPRVQIENLGPTTLGNDLIIALISTEENLKNKDKYKEIARKLADPRQLSQQQIDSLVHDGKVIVLVTCNIHSTEIGSSQMAMEWAHALATSDDPETLRRLNDVILLLVPSLNPDGQIMVTEWYRKYLGTKYEGGRMPWLYHHYVGHDNNRDWYMLTQKETIAMNRAVYQEWYPQIWLDEHQMGTTGPRIFTPPYAEPIAKSLNPLIFRGLNEIGVTMSWRLEENRKSGVIYGYSFDAYWPGGTRNTAWWKNVTGLLTEVASARVASPIDVSPTELSGGSKGLIEYDKQVNFPNPWPGGTWRLRDIMDYERIISDALLETASKNHDHYLRGVATMAMDAVHEGKPNEYWRISTDQHDPVAAARLAHLMRAHGVEVLASEDDREFIIPTAQPYGKFVAEMFSIQHYPEFKPAPNAPIVPPYDVAAWSLPLMMGVQVDKVTLPANWAANAHPITDKDWPSVSEAFAKKTPMLMLPNTNNATRVLNAALKQNASVSVAKKGFTAEGHDYPPGTLIFEANDEIAPLASRLHVQLQAVSQKPAVDVAKLHAVRVGLYKPWSANADEGWTRWVLEQYDFDPKSLDNKAIKAGNLRGSYEVIILPSMRPDMIVDGRPRTQEGSGQYFEELPAEYQGGIGREGVTALKDFVDKGGTLISLTESSDFLAEHFNIPVRNTLGRVRPEDFNCPGSLLRVHLDPTNPIAYGMPDETAAFVEAPVAFQTTPGGIDAPHSVVGWYPDAERDVLMSGWIKGADRLVRHAAIVSFTMGSGKLVMFGFPVQHRGQTEADFKLLFNAIHWAGTE